MSEADVHSRPTDPVGRVLFQIARAFAVFGGVLLFVLAILTAVSVSGRATPLGPIPGDFELIAIGTGITVFSFLPYCQIMRGNVIVDFFMEKAPVRAKAFFDIVGGILYLVIAYILTWRMVFGGFDMYSNREVSMTIGFPRWATFPISVFFMSFLVIVVVYTIGRSIAEMRAGRFFDEEPE